MNLFYLDEDFDKSAQYHVDKHIVKMPLEAAQLLCTAVWVDEVLGFVPRALNKEESKILNEEKVKFLMKKRQRLNTCHQRKDLLLHTYQ